jgi:NAD+ kinase
VLNEAVIDRGSSPFLSAIDLECDDEYITTVQGDGLIIATPTGSTAYSLAAGGSMVHPSVPAILVTPICPHTLSFRPLLVPDSSILSCKVPYDARNSAWVAFDGKFRKELQRGDRMDVHMSLHPAPTINRLSFTGDWFNPLRSQFMFNLRPKQKTIRDVKDLNSEFLSKLYDDDDDEEGKPSSQLK